MTLYYIESAVFFGLTVFSLFCLILFICKDRDINPDIVTTLVCVVLFSILYLTHFFGYEEKVANKADQFFSTRNETYECEPIDSYACKLKIKEWQQDSIYWQHKVDEIFKE